MLIVVDDEQETTEEMAELLNSENFEVQSFNNGHRFKSSIVDFEGPLDAFIFDLKMPILSGFDLIEFAKARYPNVPIIMITGHGTQVDAERALNSGANLVLLKPLQPEILIESLRQIAQKRTI